MKNIPNCLTLFLLLTLPIITRAQTLEFSSAYVRNSFYQGGHSEYNSAYSPGGGYLISAGINNIPFDNLSLKLTIGIEHFSGSVSSNFRSPGSSDRVDAQTASTDIVLGFWPLNFTIFKSIDLNFGCTGSILIGESVSQRSTASPGS